MAVDVIDIVGARSIEGREVWELCHWTNDMQREMRVKREGRIGCGDERREGCRSKVHLSTL